MYLYHFFYAAHPTSCVRCSKQLSKALAIALMVACAVAFMPLLNGQAFAAAKPGKAKSLKVTQADTMNADLTYTVTATWKVGKKAKKQQVIIKEDGVKVYSKKVSKKTKKVEYAAGKIGAKYTVSVQTLNGKKKAKAVSKSLTVVDKRAEVKSVKIEAASMAVGSTLTAVVDPAAATAATTFTWTQVGGTEAIGTGATYVAKDSDVDKQLMVTATIAGSTEYQDATLTAITTGTVIPEKAAQGDFYAYATPVYVSGNAEVVNNIPKASNIRYNWKIDGVTVQNGTAAIYTVGDYAGKNLTCVVTYTKDGETTPSTLTVDFGTVAKNIGTEYYTHLINGTTENAYNNKNLSNVAPGSTVKASLKTAGPDEKAYAGTSEITYTWTWAKTVQGVTTNYTATGAEFAIDDATKANNTITVIATAKPGADNYGGVVTAQTITTTADTVQSITIDGEAAYGGVIKATVTGSLGEITDATITWTTAPTASAFARSADGQSVTLTADAIGGSVYATAEGKASNVIANIAAGTIDKVVIKDGTNPADDLTVGSTSVGYVVKSASGGTFNPVDFTPTYYKGTSAAGAYAGEGSSANYDPSADPEMYYGVKLVAASLAAGAKYANLTTEGVQAEAVKPLKTSLAIEHLVIVDPDDPTVETEITSPYAAVTGDKIKAKTNLDTTGEAGLSFQWYKGNTLESSAIAGATSAEYVPTAADANSILFVVAKATGYQDSAAIGPITITAAPVDMDVTPVWDTTVEGTSKVEGAPTGATYQWYTLASASASPAPISGATSSSYKAVAADLGKWLQVKVTCDGYKPKTLTSLNAVEAATVTVTMKSNASGEKSTIENTLSYEADKTNAVYNEWWGVFEAGSIVNDWDTQTHHSITTSTAALADATWPTASDTAYGDVYLLVELNNGYVFAEGDYICTKSGTGGRTQYLINPHAVYADEDGTATWTIQ